MTNYYKQFPAFKQTLQTHKMPITEFRKQMMIFFGFGGRNKTIDRWITNFNNAGLIKITKDRNVMDNDDNCWMVTILDGEKMLDEEKEKCEV